MLAHGGMNGGKFPDRGVIEDLKWLQGHAHEFDIPENPDAADHAVVDEKISIQGIIIHATPPKRAPSAPRGLRTITVTLFPGTRL